MERYFSPESFSNNSINNIDEEGINSIINNVLSDCFSMRASTVKFLRLNFKNKMSNSEVFVLKSPQGEDLGKWTSNAMCLIIWSHSDSSNSYKQKIMSGRRNYQLRGAGVSD